MINNYTASAAEIIARHMQLMSEQNGDQLDQPLVFLVGTPSFGKGSVQEVMELSNGCAIKITTALYFFPDDTTVQGQGIIPDFIIPKQLPESEHVQWIQKLYGHEKTLTGYIKVNPEEDEVTKEDDTSSASQEPLHKVKKLLEEDNQFKETVTLANILNVGLTHCPTLVNTRNKALNFLQSIHVSPKTPTKLLEL